MRFTPFLMERWQSTYEHRYNLSDSGVHPLALGDLLAEDGQVEELLASRLNYTQSTLSPKAGQLHVDPFPLCQH